MKISNKILSLPPYISTTWENILSLHMKNSLLVITLSSGESISIPQLDSIALEQIFTAHAAYLESDLPTAAEEMPRPSHQLMAMLPPHIQAMILRSDQQPHQEAMIGFGITAFDGLSTVMQHDENHAEAPDLPSELLEKIAAIANIVAPVDASAFSSAEPDCNCPHCQIARAIGEGDSEVKGCQSLSNLEGEAAAVDDQEVSLEELQFQQWSIEQQGEQLYAVSNKLDSHEKYTVFLGSPVGCTCGATGCEHILAVLKS
jgi:hypothetical protein